MYDHVKRLFDIPRHQQKAYPKKDAFTAKINGKWEPTSIDTVLKEAMKVSKSLLKLGIGKGDKIGLISNNRPEWVAMDYGILQVGAVDVPIYPTVSAEDYKFIFNDAKLKYCFVSDMELFNKVNSIKDQVPSL